ncbi:MAG: hypothetical protein V2A63_04850 [Patescibacteria group bacterium]
MQRTLTPNRIAGVLLTLALFCFSWMFFAANTRAAEGEEIRGDNLKPEVITLKEDKEAYSEKSKELGYRPGEIQIKFKQDEIDLTTDKGKQQAEEWLSKKTDELLPILTEKLKAKGHKPPVDFTGEMFSIRDNSLYKRSVNPKFDSNFIRLKYTLSDRVEDLVTELEKDPLLEYVSINHIGYIPKEDIPSTESSDTSFFFESFSSSGQFTTTSSATE